VYAAETVEEGVDGAAEVDQDPAVGRHVGPTTAALVIVAQVGRVVHQKPAQQHNFTIVDIRKDRGDNPQQDSSVKESAIRLLSETRHPADTDSTETELTLLKFRSGLC
jgi:hypothetical protein